MPLSDEALEALAHEAAKAAEPIYAALDHKVFVGGGMEVPDVFHIADTIRRLVRDLEKAEAREPDGSYSVSTGGIEVRRCDGEVEVIYKQYLH